MNDAPQPADLPGGPISAALRQDGYCFTSGQAMRAILWAASGSDPLADPQHGWARFAASWDDLGLDTYMADGGRYRRRRFVAFAASAAGLRRKPHQPHYQSRDYNALNGGIARWFDPVTDQVAALPVLRDIIAACQSVFDSLVNPAAPLAWHVELHQFRITARVQEAGEPTPEGLHQDGVDFVLVLLINRQNIASGVTSIHDAQRRNLGSFTLTAPLDAAWVDDNRVFHGVTAVRPIDPALPAHRDVLVVTFRRDI